MKHRNSRGRNTRPLLALLAAVAVILSACATGPGARRFAPGSFLGVGPGFYGPIIVEVSMPAANRIDGIRIVAHDETHNVGNIPIELYSELIVNFQSLDVPIISGATVSSVAMLSAVRDAISRAGANPADFRGPVTLNVPAANTSADIVVIGSGGAGLTSAIFAARAGRNVILLEKSAIIGGTSNYIIEQIGSVGSITHQTLGTDVTPAMFTQTVIAGAPNAIPEAMQLLVNNMGWAVNWLRSIGVPFTNASVQTGVRPDWQIGEPGPAIVSGLRLEAQRAGVDVRTWSRATEVIMQDGAVAGVRVSTPNGEYTINAPAVILATGGFTANRDMVAEHRPDLAHLGFASSSNNQGDGHRMAQEVGAALTNMNHIRMGATYATSASGIHYWVNHPLNWGAILVNRYGQRFMNDQAGWPGGPAALAQGNPLYYIFDNTIVEVAREVRRLSRLGIFITADTLDELFDLMTADTAGLRNTIDRYRGFVAAGVDADFNRPMLNMNFDTPPFHAIRAEVRIQGTFGGVSTNLDAQVLTPGGQVIPGLFAAGEVADEGTWGQNPAASIVVFGRIAGQSATAFVASR